MDTDAWLEQELAELDEAEQFIHNTMSAFVSSNRKVRGSHPGGHDRGDASVTLDSKQKEQVTKSLSNSNDSVGKNVGEVSLKKQGKSNHLQPLSNTERLQTIQKENKSPPISDLPSPPPPLNPPPSASQTRNPPTSAMSKSPPPPVLPKPPRSQFQTRTGVGAITVQLNKPVSPSSPPTNSLPNSFSLPDPPPPDDLPSPPPPIQQLPSPPKPKNDISFPPPDLSPPPSALSPPPPAQSFSSSQSAPFRGIPKEIEKNSMDELDFLTNNLLLNMDNPKDENFYGYCEKCGGVVEGENVGCNALDKVYHIACFTCETCNAQLHGNPFYVVGKKSLCEPCYLASLETCCICSKVITDRILRATDKVFHPSCFKCGVCGKVLDGVPFTIDDSKNIYCIDDFHQTFASRCSVCKLPILPESGRQEALRIVAMDRDFHVHCYKCEKCDVQLSSEEGCYPLDGHLYCLDCNTEILSQLSV